MITIKLPISLTAEDAKFVEEQQIVQSSMIRSAYKSASYGLAEISVRAELKSRFCDSGLDSWYQQSAVKSGMGMFKADSELGVTKRIFGGKKNLVRRSKNLITNDEWKSLRILPLYIIGESPRRGNRKFDFGIDSITFKPHKDKRIEIRIPKMRKNWYKLWSQAVIMANEKLIPITVSLTSNYICLTFEDSKVKESSCRYKKPIKTRYAGVDLNPNYIGVSIFDNGHIVDTKLFSLSTLTGKNVNDGKLEHETVEVCHSIGKWLKYNQVDKLFLEDLSFKQGDKGLGKNFNRLTNNQWKRVSIESTLGKYFKILKVNAAYSSTIGNLLNPSYPDPIAASMEIARRGYEVTITKSKKFYPELISKRELQNRWKEIEFPEFSTWKELHDFVKKKAKLKYRNPLPKEESFRIFSSPKSFVGVL
jgi:hypothetical protein